MGLKPTHEFYIPSVNDGTRLGCRLYHPQQIDGQGEQGALKGAVIAHPYATLGGSNDDLVVSSVAGELVRQGYIVSTFNFRGAGDSGGNTSWTAKAELADYISVYGFMLQYLSALASQDRRDKTATGSGDSQPPTSTSGQQEGRPKPEASQLLLVGYSYGAMIASHLPTVEDVSSLFADPASSSSAETICLKAKELAKTTEDPHGETGKDATPGTVPTISYLLLSPILPPASQFVTLFSNLSSVWIQGRQISTVPPVDQLPTHRTLIIYGTDDMFTSEKKLRDWTKALTDAPGSLVQSQEIPMAGHFWTEQRFHTILRQAINAWEGHVQ